MRDRTYREEVDTAVDGLLPLVQQCPPKGCVITSLKAIAQHFGVEVETDPRPRNTMIGADRLRAAGLQVTDITRAVTPLEFTDGGWQQAPRPKTITYKRFVREHPHGVYLLRNHGHGTALVEGTFIDTQKHGPDTRRIQSVWKVTKP